MWRHPRFFVLLVVATSVSALRLAGSVSPDAPEVVAAFAFVLFAAAALVVMVLPGVGVLGLALHRYPPVADSLALGVAIAVVAMCLAWWSVFWLWALWPVAGAASAVIGCIIATALVMRHLPALRHLGAASVAVLAVPFAAVLLANGILFARAGLSNALASAQSIYGMADNWFPHEWASRVLNGGDLRTPALGGWPMPDRPPVQAAITLPSLAISGNWEMASQVGGSLLQGLGVLGVVLVMFAAGLRRERLIIAGLLVTLTAFMTVGLAYVWPKLFASGLLLVAAAVFIEVGGARTGAPSSIPTMRSGRGARTPLASESAGVAWVAVLALVSISAVVHPVGILGLPVVLVAAVRHPLPRPPRRWVLGLLAMPALFAGGWLSYRLFVDSSPSTVAQWHLAGVRTPTSDDSLLVVVADRYREVGLIGALHLRWENLQILAGVRFFGPLVSQGAGSSLSDTLQRSLAVPLLTPSFLLLGTPLLWWWRRLPRPTVTLVVGALLSMLVWLAVFFGPPLATAVTTHGPYAAFLALAAALALAVVTLLPRWASAGVLAGQGALWFVLMLYKGGDTRCFQTNMCVPYELPAGLDGPRLVAAPVAGMAILGVVLLALALGQLGRSPSVLLGAGGENRSSEISSRDS